MGDAAAVGLVDLQARDRHRARLPARAACRTRRGSCRCRGPADRSSPGPSCRPASGRPGRPSRAGCRSCRGRCGACTRSGRRAGRPSRRRSPPARPSSRRPRAGCRCDCGRPDSPAGPAPSGRSPRDRARPSGAGRRSAAARGPADRRRRGSTRRRSGPRWCRRRRPAARRGEPAVRAPSAEHLLLDDRDLGVLADRDDRSGRAARCPAHRPPSAGRSAAPDGRRPGRGAAARRDHRARVIWASLSFSGRAQPPSRRRRINSGSRARRSPSVSRTTPASRASGESTSAVTRFSLISA